MSIRIISIHQSGAAQAANQAACPRRPDSPVQIEDAPGGQRRSLQPLITVQVRGSAINLADHGAESPANDPQSKTAADSFDDHISFSSSCRADDLSSEMRAQRLNSERTDEEYASDYILPIGSTFKIFSALLITAKNSAPCEGSEQSSLPLLLNSSLRLLPPPYG